jgi:hypothetical protein
VPPYWGVAADVVVAGSLLAGVVTAAAVVVTGVVAAAVDEEVEELEHPETIKAEINRINRGITSFFITFLLIILLS